MGLWLMAYGLWPMAYGLWICPFRLCCPFRPFWILNESQSGAASRVGCQPEFGLAEDAQFQPFEAWRREPRV